MYSFLYLYYFTYPLDTTHDFLSVLNVIAWFVESLKMKVVGCHRWIDCILSFAGNFAIGYNAEVVTHMIHTYTLSFPDNILLYISNTCTHTHICTPSFLGTSTSLSAAMHAAAEGGKSDHWLRLCVMMRPQRVMVHFTLIN